MAAEVLAESYVMATGYAALMGAGSDRQHLFARRYDQPVTVAQLTHDWKEFTLEGWAVSHGGTRVVIAGTVAQARTIARGLAQPGAVALSPRSIRGGAGRGLVIASVLVDETVWPLDQSVLGELMPSCQSVPATWWIRRGVSTEGWEWSTVNADAFITRDTRSDGTVVTFNMIEDEAGDIFWAHGHVPAAEFIGEINRWLTHTVDEDEVLHLDLHVDHLWAKLDDEHPERFKLVDKPWLGTKEQADSVFPVTRLLL